MKFRMQTPSNSISAPPNFTPNNNSTAQIANRKRIGMIGVVLMVVSESIFFLSAFWGYFYTRIIALEWPPAGIGQPQLDLLTRVFHPIKEPIKAGQFNRIADLGKARLDHHVHPLRLILLFLLATFFSQPRGQNPRLGLRYFGGLAGAC